MNFFIVFLFLFLPPVGTNGKLTRYKPGFTYESRRGEKLTLLAFVPTQSAFQPNLHRWKVKGEYLGLTYQMWTDDTTIDVETGKAFYVNEGVSKRIVYWDSLNYDPIQGGSLGNWYDLDTTGSALYYKPLSDKGKQLDWGGSVYYSPKSWTVNSKK